MLKNLKVLVRLVSLVFVVYTSVYTLCSFVMFFALFAKRFSNKWFDEWKSFIKKTRFGWREYK